MSSTRTWNVETVAEAGALARETTSAVAEARVWSDGMKLSAEKAISDAEVSADNVQDFWTKLAKGWLLPGYLDVGWAKLWRVWESASGVEQAASEAEAEQSVAGIVGGAIEGAAEDTAGAVSGGAEVFTGIVNYVKENPRKSLAFGLAAVMLYRAFPAIVARLVVR